MAVLGNQLLVAAFVVALLTTPFRAYASCQDLPAGEQRAGTARRALEVDDLVRIRDIGAVAVVNRGAHTFTVSPDGKHIALQLRRAEPKSNDFCLSMVVLDIGSKALPRVVDEGGNLIRWNSAFRGKVGFPSGVPITITPRWSPDGSSILFLKRTDGSIQIWRARADGSGSEQLTHSLVDVEDFEVTPDGRAVIFATRPDLMAVKQNINREGDRGYRYDDRFSPMTSNRPFPAGGDVFRFEVQNLETGLVRSADDNERSLFTSPLTERATEEAASPDGTGRKAWIVPPTGGEFFWNSRLAANDLSGKSVRCGAPACTSWVSKPWWSSDGQRVLFFRREGWAQSDTAIYEWNVDQSAPRRIYSTSDLLFDCAPRNDTLICLRESSLQPRELVEIDLTRSTSITLFDPNPEFAGLNLGRVERLHWRNRYGIESYGDLIYPVGYRQGHRYPLIVVQYDTRGFLRGGTGDEYPIQVFANHGFMVLSFQRPRDIGYFRAKNEAGVDAANLDDFADRQSVQSSLDTGLILLLNRGLIDRSRLGITGLSDGVATVQYALIHNPVFRAAAISNCCFDASSMLLVGPKASRHFQSVGYPPPTKKDGPFWDRFSLARNAKKIETPILMQEADDEYLTGLETYGALTDAGRAVDMYVYPDEHHIKWQPAHRRAIYLRNVWWFDYWLKNLRPSSAEGQLEANVWDALRRRDRKLARAAHSLKPPANGLSMLPRLGTP